MAQDPTPALAGSPGQGGASAPASGALPALEIPMRRLTREQYQNTVRDLLGVQYPATERLTADETMSGFRTNTGLTVQELQVEQYQTAAEEIAHAAVVPALLPDLAPCAIGADLAGCARSFIERFARRAYRRPATDAEAARLQALFVIGQKADFATGIQLVIEAALQSPSFLYRPEFGGAAAGGPNTLAPYEITSRLSYLLWNTMPDEPLFAAAGAGELGAAADIARHAARMLGDQRASAMWSSFADQWLGTDAARSIERDPAHYPRFSKELQAALSEQTGRYFDFVARTGDGLLSTLLTSRRAPLSPPLFELYGLPPATAGDNGWQVMDLPADQRAGLFTLAPFLAVNSHADQTSLVRRGREIRKKLLCTVPPPPPPGVDVTVPAVDPNLTARERFAVHRANPVCASCHALMDPLGLPFEVYDPIGAYRTSDGSKPIDSSGTLTGTATQDGDVSGPLDLIQRIANADEVTTCVAKQLFRYSFSRMEASDDEATLAELTSSFRASNRHLASLLTAIASSPAFRTGPHL